MALQISEDHIARAPKVLLHDHLDGGLRPQTMIEHALASGYTKLPSYDAVELGHWFVEACSSGTLELYLETFEHTISVMQTQEEIIRVARECVLDLAADGVLYAEVRGAPELFTRKGLTMDQVIEATVEGFSQGTSEIAHSGKRIRVEHILCALRQNHASEEVASKVVKYKGRGVVGFDIAGPEAGFPPTDHIKAFNYLQSNGAHYTIHAGEAFGVESISLAVRECSAERIGHGIRLIDDIDFSNGQARLGSLAQEILDRQICLEMAPTSNLQTGGAASYATHQIGVMKKLGFNVTLNTDNRLMSATSMIREVREIADGYNWNINDLHDIARNGIYGAFISREEQDEIYQSQINPVFNQITSELSK
ncbi:MAG: adenosine deaminase [Candidatus Planktophila sp.]|jgi:adenosine deaminase|tara:strand:+ start:2475 stop:3572 length:1098 start_codon:yes stop_codon:yes gene_type:complete